MSNYYCGFCHLIFIAGKNGPRTQVASSNATFPIQGFHSASLGVDIVPPSRLADFRDEFIDHVAAHFDGVDPRSVGKRWTVDKWNFVRRCENGSSVHGKTAEWMKQVMMRRTAGSQMFAS